MELKILDFMSTWCSPCLTMSPILEEIEKETGIEVLKVDVDENEELTNAFQIRNIPTLVFLKDGEIVYKISGTVTKTALLDKITELR